MFTQTRLTSTKEAHCFYLITLMVLNCRQVSPYFFPPFFLKNTLHRYPNESERNKRMVNKSFIKYCAHITRYSRKLLNKTAKTNKFKKMIHKCKWEDKRTRTLLISHGTKNTLVHFFFRSIFRSHVRLSSLYPFNSYRSHNGLVFHHFPLNFPPSVAP